MLTLIIRSSRPDHLAAVLRESSPDSSPDILTGPMEADSPPTGGAHLEIAAGPMRWSRLEHSTRQRLRARHYDTIIILHNGAPEISYWPIYWLAVRIASRARFVIDDRKTGARRARGAVRLLAVATVGGICEPILANLGRILYWSLRPILREPVPPR